MHRASDAALVPRPNAALGLRRRAIPLDENEGIYVRDIKTGRVRAVTGQTYMLKENEELWSKGARALFGAADGDGDGGAG